MRSLVAAAPGLVLLALLAACGGDGKGSSAAFPGATWQLEYSSSGGIAGLNQRIVLDQTGKATFEDKRLNRAKDVTLPASDLSRIVGLMRAANLPALKSDQGLPVPDSIITSLKVTSGNLSYGGTLNQTSSAGPQVRTLVQALSTLYDAYKP